MCHKNAVWMKWGFLLVLPLTGLPTGCGTIFGPSPETVLAGTWSLTTPSSTDLTQLLLTFNQNGALTTVVYKVGTGITITSNAPTGTTTVAGNNVTITADFIGGALSFNGTLNAAQTVIDGTFTTTITVGTLVISIDSGRGTLTKQ
jgi:hypothetical protein